MKKINTLKGQKVKNKPSKPKNEIFAPKSVWLCDILIVRKFYMKQEKYTFWAYFCFFDPQKCIFA
jgi:hypothetical protein